MYFGMFNLGPLEIIVVMIIVLLIFGPKKLPQIGRSFGEMLSNFRQGTGEDKAEDKADKAEDRAGDKAGDGEPDVKQTDKDKR